MQENQRHQHKSSHNILFITDQVFCNYWKADRKIWLFLFHVLMLSPSSARISSFYLCHLKITKLRFTKYRLSFSSLNMFAEWRHSMFY